METDWKARFYKQLEDNKKLVPIYDQTHFRKKLISRLKLI